MGHGHKFNAKHFKKLEYAERFKEQPFERLQSLLDFNNCKTFVDLGCGSGFHTFHFANAISEGSMVYALDVSKEMIERLEHNMDVGGPIKLLAPSDRSKIKGIVIEEDKFPLLDHSVDLFFNSNVFHEMSDHNRFFTELNRVMKQNGIVFTLDWKKAEAKKGPPLHHRVSREKVETLFIENSYEVVDSGVIFEYFHYVKAIRKI